MGNLCFEKVITCSFCGYTYPKIKNGSFGEADENIMIEINSFASPHPFARQKITSYIADFLAQKEPTKIGKYKLESFSVTDTLPDIKDINESVRIIGDILKEKNL